MTDTNLPTAWRVIDNKTGKTVAEFPVMLRALAHCQELEPGENHFGYRYTMEPVRPTQERG